MQIHADERRFKCTVLDCWATFYNKQDLHNHAASVHREERDFACSICFKSFKLKVGLAQHLKIHKGITFHCDICGVDLKDKHYFKIHKMKHDGTFEKLHVCNFCGKNVCLIVASI